MLQARQLSIGARLHCLDIYGRRNLYGTMVLSRQYSLNRYDSLRLVSVEKL